MSYAYALDSALQYSRGLVAGIIGPAYAVYRVGPTSYGSVLDGPPVIPLISARFERVTDRKIVEDQTYELATYLSILDATRLILGDVIVGTEGTFVHAQRGLNQQTVSVRCEAVATIQRPRDLAALVAPPSTIPGGPRVGGGHDSTSQVTNDVLALVAGQYGFALESSAPVAARVPLGLQPTARVGGSRPDALPDSELPARYVGYLPPLGIDVEPNWILVVDDAHRYVISAAFSSGSTGIAGSVLVLERDGV